MLESTATYGSMESSDSVKRLCAAASLHYNCKDKSFQQLFPQFVELYIKTQAEKASNLVNSNENSPSFNNNVAQSSAAPSNAAQLKPSNNLFNDSLLDKLVIAIALLSIMFGYFYWLQE
jgi:hypothetical protein